MGFWEIICLIVAWQKGFLAGILTYLGGYAIAFILVFGFMLVMTPQDVNPNIRKAIGMEVPKNIHYMRDSNGELLLDKNGDFIEDTLDN